MKITDAQFAGSSAGASRLPAVRLPEFAFIGRSNVGKSSLINMLCNNRKLAMTSATPGKTRLINRFRINGSWYLVDLPGYGYARLSKKERDEISAMIRGYVLGAEDLVMLMVLIDSRHDIGKADMDFLSMLGENGVPFAIVFTKCDKLGPNALAAQLARDEEILLGQWEELPPTFRSSAMTGMGREEILDCIDSVLKSLYK